MRFATVFTLGAAVSTSASLVARQSYPTCAITCITNANLGGCVSTDTHCLCTNSTFISSTTACIESGCTGSDLQQALTLSQQACLSVSVTLTASIGTATATATSSGTSTSSPSATASKAAATVHGVNSFVGLAAAGLVAIAL